MAKLLVHLVTGPENPTRGALAFLVAKTAAANGHEVTMFLAGDGVAYVRDPIMDAAIGIGTGNVRDHYADLAAAGGKILASGMSGKARGIGPDAVGDKEIEFAPPDRLVELIVEADRVVTY